MEEETVSVPLLIFQSLSKVASGISPLLVLALVISICILTRITTGITSRLSKTYPDGTVSVRQVPYWLPYAGHAFSLGFRRRKLFENARKSTKEPVVSLNVRGKSHNAILSPAMAAALLKQSSSLSTEPATDYILKNAFGAGRSVGTLNRSDFYGDSGPIQFLNKEPWLTDITSAIARQVQQAMPNLLSFSPSVVDQSTWERVSDVSISHENGEPICEVYLFALVRNFIGTISTTALMGSAFTETFPYALNELWNFDGNFNAILSSIPRWIPFPGLVSSYSSRRRLLLAMKVFHDAFAATEIGVDPGFDWRDMDDVSEVVKARSRALIEAGCSAEAAASEHLAFFWAMNTITNTLVFWNLVHILSDEELHEKILEEIAPYSNAARPDWRESGFNIPEPPRLRLDANALVSSCPILKATYYESLRLYSLPLSYGQVTKDVSLAEPTVVDSPSSTYKCEAGTYVAIPHFIHNMNTDSFHEPTKFDPQRIFPHDLEKDSDTPDNYESSENEKLISNDSISQKVNDIWPSEASPVLGFSREFAEGQALVFTAAFLTMWDIQRASGRRWTVPRQKAGSAVCVPRNDVMVRMKLRV
ncbi:uncharacterized protein CIMG_10963 [Coccidioides immitis RS]|uniref:Cytochrome P450 n=3 Tax=Coccidioides immitis TaxID=5501 RepID=A0A0D8JRM3_COCIM|nr:uncharacterized protein CIMG_10963 [Coccidioides immitis RS]KJF60005.1 hypothetical protein CIMG_10963 [Coccidioides immitis RS]KMP10071.1 AhbB [Coccidioides immitis RMSCC 2394]